MVSSGFFNSIGGDRKYTNSQFSSIISTLVTDGVFQHWGEKLYTTPVSGMEVGVKTGFGWFNDAWIKNDSLLVIEVPVSDLSLARYDAIVVEMNTSEEVRDGTIKLIKGTPASTPVKPTLVNEGFVHQYPLAYIKVEPTVTAIEEKDIKIVVGLEACPFVTGILATTDISEMFDQWTGEFNEWFDHIKGQLSGDIAANLQLQIDELEGEIPKKATTEEILAGIDDSKYITPAGAKSLSTRVGDVTISAIDLEKKSNGKWLRCDSRAVSIDAYPKLFNVLGYSHGYQYFGSGSLDNKKYTVPVSISSANFTTALQAIISKDGSLFCGVGTGAGLQPYFISRDGSTTLTNETLKFQYAFAPFFIDDELFLISAEYSSDSAYNLYRVDYSTQQLLFTSILSGIYWTKDYGITGFYAHENVLDIITFGETGNNRGKLMVTTINTSNFSASITFSATGEVGTNRPLVIGNTIYWNDPTSNYSTYNLDTKTKTYQAQSTWPLVGDTRLIAWSPNYKYSLIIRFNVEPILYFINNQTSEITKLNISDTGGGSSNYKMLDVVPTSPNQIMPSAYISNTGDMDVYLTIRHRNDNNHRYIIKPIVKFGNSTKHEQNFLIMPILENYTDKMPLSRNVFLSYSMYADQVMSVISFKTLNPDVTVLARSVNSKNTLVYNSGIDKTRFRIPYANAVNLSDKDRNLYGFSNPFPYVQESGIFICGLE